MARPAYCANCSSWHDPLLGRCPPEERRIYEAPSRADAEEVEELTRAADRGRKPIAIAKASKPKEGDSGGTRKSRETNPAKPPVTADVPARAQAQVADTTPSSSNGRTSDFGSENPRSSRGEGTNISDIERRLNNLETSLGVLDAKFDELDEAVGPLKELAQATLKAREKARERQNKRRGKAPVVA